MISEICQTEKGNTVCHPLMWNLRNKTDECIYQNRNRLTDTKNKRVDTNGERETGTGKTGVWD